MKLTYRGVAYQENAARVEAQTVEQAGKYRGVEFAIEQHSAKSPHARQPMKYRGVAID
ncbi:MAG: DUF4278 domain-containing protein [Geitlerinemataceae cyanobacterium]